ncbi:MAG: S8 family serine peptidase [Vicinamibacteria bacterium]|nr:S8 family serine peptidase [Vicinamibacteria bacterium]
MTRNGNVSDGRRMAMLLAFAAGMAACAQTDLPAPEPDIGAGPEATEFAPGYIVVKVDRDASEQELSELARSVGGRDLTKPSFADFYYVHLDEGVDPVAAARALSGQRGIKYAEADPRYHALFVPSDPLYKHQWHFSQIGMEQAWDINPGATSDVVVAVLDSGVAYRDFTIQYPNTAIQFAQAPDLKGTSFVEPYDFVWNNAYPLDLDGHGTHVTGTIAQRTDNGVGGAGMAYNASIMPVKVLPAGDIGGPDGRMYPGLDYQFGLRSLPYGASTVARAIRYAADKGADVINLSLGGLYPSLPNKEALEYAVSQGVFVAIAAGNSAQDGNPIIYPARYAQEIDGVVAVGAVDINRARAKYSQIGSYVEIAAPGGDTGKDVDRDGEPDGVYQQTIDPVGWNEAGCYWALTRRPYDFTWPPNLQTMKFLPFQGTSMAAPHVAGFAALLKSQGLDSPAVIEAAMKRFAEDLGASGRDDQTGYGLINPRATLLGIGLAR